MNKDRQSREKCKYCQNVMRKDGYYICRLRPEMRLDRYTRRPDWCRKKMVVIGPVKDLKLNNKKIADEGFVTGLSVIDETDEWYLKGGISFDIRKTISDS